MGMEALFADLPILCIIVNAKGRSKQGRLGTEARENPFCTLQFSWYCVILEVRHEGR